MAPKKMAARKGAKRIEKGQSSQAPPPPKRARTTRAAQGNTQTPIPTDSSRNELGFDAQLFRNREAFDFYEKVVKFEELNDYRVFDFESLAREGFDLRPQFDVIGIARFCECKEPIYVDLVRQFYSNLVEIKEEDDVDRAFGEIVFESIVNGTMVRVSEDLLEELFGLPNSGKECSGDWRYKTVDGEIRDYSTDEIEECSRWIYENFVVIKVRDHNWAQNDFGAYWRMVHLAITKSLTCKEHSSATYTNKDREVVYWLMKDAKVNFGCIVLNFIKKRFERMSKEGYKRVDRQQKEGLPYATQLTRIFSHFGVSFEGYNSAPVRKNKIVKGSNLKSLKLYKTKNRGWVYWHYLTEEDELEDASVVKPQGQDRVARRVKADFQVNRPLATRKKRITSTSGVSIEEFKRLEAKVDRIEDMVKNVWHFIALQEKRRISQEQGISLDEVPEPRRPQTPPPPTNPEGASTSQNPINEGARVIVQEGSEMISEVVRKLNEDGQGQQKGDDEEEEEEGEEEEDEEDSEESIPLATSSKSPSPAH